jgi:LacI family transcriptional regulator, galactose operon repressor
VNTRAPSKRKPTQGDVAARAGVSQATVSYVLANSTAVKVPEETRQRILLAAQELGYVPNSAARMLRTRKTMTIAAVIPDITNPFYPWFERGIQEVAESKGYDLITYNTDGDVEKERKAVQSAREGRVDGLIMTVFHVTATDLAPLVLAGVSVVVLGRANPAWSEAGIDSLSIDNVGAAQAAVDHLLDEGHTRIAMIAGVEGTPPRDQRVLGYRQALAAHDVPIEERLIRAGEYTEQGGYEATEELLRLSPRPTAIFAANDLMAIGALQALREANVAVPGQMALVGFDDIPAASLVHPALTTIAQFPHPLGKAAAEMLFERLSGTVTGMGCHRDMPHELIVRESA